MSIALIVTRGFGNGTLTGSIKDVVTRGYTIGTVVAEPLPTLLEGMSFISRTVENSMVSITPENSFRHE